MADDYQHNPKLARTLILDELFDLRSEERRVGKECRL